MIDGKGGPQHGIRPAADSVLTSISIHIDKDQELLAGIGLLLERTGYSKQDIVSKFGSVDDLLVALAMRCADQLAEPLTRRDIKCVADVRKILVRFGAAAWKSYATTFVGLLRIVIAEGRQRKELRDRVYQAGPARVSRMLCDFLVAAKDANILDAPDPSLAAEQLMGLLREPLYQALLLHPAAESGDDDNEAVTRAVDLLLDGCARSTS